LDDREIIKLYLERSEEAIIQTETKYGRYCHQIANNILNNSEDSEECVNDTFLRAWGSIPPNEPQSMSAFLGKITRNLALDKLRRRSSSKRGGGEAPLVLDELLDCVSGVDEFERLHDSEEITTAINEFLGTLNYVERGVFMRRYWMMESIDSIAERFDITTSKATTMLFRLRGRLKKQLMKEGIPL